MKQKPKKAVAAKKRKTPASAQRKKILLVDDHPMMREGLRGTINSEPGLMVCGEAETARQALDEVKKLGPDLVLTDITLTGKSGLELVKDLHALHPEVPVLVLSMHDESLYAERMIRAGARGYITKHQPPRELINAIHQILSGRPYVSQLLSDSILTRFSGIKPVSAARSLELLTDREFEILQLVAKGMDARQMAASLHLSPKTVAVHTANIRKKLEITNFSGLVRFATQWESIKNLAGD